MFVLKVLVCVLMVISERRIYSDLVVEQVSDTIDIYKPRRENIADECEIGQYGPLCLEECHCLMAETCNKITGHCPHGCKTGYKPPICGECERGYFGEKCSSQCHCLLGSMDCHVVSGECPGGCTPGYEGLNCQTLTGFPIVDSVLNTTQNIGQNITVSCSATGLPSPNITILSRTLDVLHSEDKALKGKVGSTNRWVMRTTYFETANETGLLEFHCLSTNVHGEAKVDFFVNIAAPPILKLAPSVDHVTSDSVSLSWRPWKFALDEGGTADDVVEYLPVYRPVGEIDWSSNGDWEKETFAEIVDLASDTDYEFSIQSRRQGVGGAGNPGQIHQAVTKCGVPDSHSEPRDLIATHVGSNSASFTWLPPGHLNIKCGVNAYVLTWYEDGGEKETEILTEGVADYRLENLNSSTLYHIGLQAVTKIGYGSASEISFRTVDSVPGPVANLQHEMIPGGVSLKWNPPKDTSPSEIKEYYVRAELLSLGSCDAIPPEVDVTYLDVTTSKNKVTMTQFYANSKYNVSVRGRSTKGDGDAVLLSVDLPETEPSVEPPNVTAITSSSQMTFQWEPIPCYLSNGDVFYRYSLKRRDAAKIKKRRQKRSDGWIVKDKETTGNSVSVEKLEPFNEYEFSVRGVTSAGEGPAFNATYWTKDALPVPPKMRVTNNHPTKILVMVTPPSGESGRILGYQIKYGRQDGVGDELFQDLNSMMSLQWLNDLDPDTGYNLQIRAKSRSGWGEWSKIHEQKTQEGVPSVVNDLKFVQVNSSAILVSWLPPNSTNGVLKKYKLECRLLTDSNATSPAAAEDYYNVKFEIDSNSTLEAVFSDLAVGNHYSVFVTAGTASGFGRSKNVTAFLFDPAVSRSGDIDWLPGPPDPQPVTFRYDNYSNPSLIYTIKIFPVNDSVYEKPDFYQIIVIDFQYDPSLATRDLNHTLIFDYIGAQRRREAYWISGQLPASEFEDASEVLFDVGNREFEGTYYNGPMISDYGQAFVVRPVKYSKPVAFYMTSPTEFSKGVDPLDDISNVELAVAMGSNSRFVASLTWSRPKYRTMDQIKWFIVNLELTSLESHCDGKVNDFAERKTKDLKVYIPNLYPDTNYTILIKTVSLKTITSYSIKLTTNESAPTAAPENVAAIDSSATSISFRWNSIPCHYAGGHLQYRYWLCPVSAETEDAHYCAEGIVTKDLSAKIENLQSNSSYTFRVAGETSMGIGIPSKQIIFGTTAGATASALPFEGCYILGLECFWMVIIVIVVFAIFWIVLLSLLFCKRSRRNKRNLAANNLTTGNKTEGIWAISNMQRSEEETALTGVFEPTAPATGKTETFKKSTFFGPISVKDLAEYVTVRSTHATVGFPEEFKQLSKEKHGSMNVAKKSENIKKNRYGNILPYDQTRVRLEPLAGMPDTDYINASFIDGYARPKVYIATQGPKENTFQDFWRMVNQEKVAVIVMITSLSETKKKKYEQYWPNHFRLYGDILVTLIDTVHSADITVRHFQLKIVGTNEIRSVTHYQYGDWPEGDVSPCVTSVVELRRRIRDELPSRAGPVVVHCSGGAGRTGTFIAIDAILQQAYEEEFVHIFQFVNNIRRQRTSLVQTVDQYRFIYDAVLEALQSGNTTVLCSRFPVYYRDICRTSADEPSDLVNQFNILANLERRKSCYPCPTALLEENVGKNRNPEILPVEHSRVRLVSDVLDDTPGTSDPYINAIFCDGFRQKQQFLITSMPLDETTEDFWHMVIKYRSSIVVMLNDSEFIDEQIVPGQYWPNDGCTEYGPYRVEVVMFEEKGMVNMRTMRITDLRKPELDVHCVIQLQFLDWTPKDEVPSSASSFIAMTNMVNVLQRKYGGPITVHCGNGASRTGVFCVCHVIKENVETGEVDVFQAVKRVRRHRPQLITSEGQYKFCYEAALELAIDYNERTSA